jgi:hypothetical protein
MTADKVTEALAVLDEESLDCMVSDWVHCAVGHGNDAPFVAKYIRSHLAHRLKPVFEALERELAEAKAETERALKMLENCDGPKFG